MSLLTALVQKAMVLVLACVYGVLVVIKLAAETVKLGPKKAFTRKKRSSPPSCLEDPSLGSHGYAHLEDIRMHYVSNGAEDKPLMLLVHGFPEFWYSWRHQLREFKDSYRVVAVDMRGYGDSDKPPGKGDYAFFKLLNDLKQIITALGYSRCVLVGHDKGGVLCWVFAEMYPDMLSRLIILNAPNPRFFKGHLTSSFKQFKMSWYTFFFQLPWLPEFAFQFNDFAILDFMIKSRKAGVRTEYTTAEDMEAYKYNLSRNGSTGPINFYRCMYSLDSLSGNRFRPQGSTKRGVTMPTLVIWGEKEGALDKVLIELSLAACTGKAEIKYIEGASHWVQMDRPDLVNKYIREFLAQE